jgi:2-hydroxychromene-2-carboxylate isomerase
MMRWARWWGVPFEMPRQFPQRTIAAQRLILVADREGHGIELAIALGRAMWAEQRNLEDTATLAELATRVAPDRASGWLAAIASPEIKDALIANTTAAKAAKVFGVPTFVVGDQLFWGQDRLDLVAAALEQA